jgi:hypothetical protein
MIKLALLLLLHQPSEPVQPSLLSRSDRYDAQFEGTLHCADQQQNERSPAVCITLGGVPLLVSRPQQSAKASPACEH